MLESLYNACNEIFPMKYIAAILKMKHGISKIFIAVDTFDILLTKP